MEIQRKNPFLHSVPFKDIKDGEVFQMYEDSLQRLYLKIKSTGQPGHQFRGVELKTGVEMAFDSMQRCIPVRGKFVEES